MNSARDFGIWTEKNRTSIIKRLALSTRQGESNYESKPLHSQALCEVQDYQAQRQIAHYLRKSETQTATRIG
jgi:hypothetical protein